MNLTTELSKKLYGKRPSSEEERQLILSFLEAERECDEYNKKQIEQMDLSHLGKGNLNKTNAAMKRWTKDNESLTKAISKAEIYEHNETRNWYY